VPTVPVTFHLPIELRDRIKITAQAKQKTMLEIAVEALQDYLDRNHVSESDLRKLLGLLEYTLLHFYKCSPTL